MDYVDGSLLVDPGKMKIDGFKDEGREMPDSRCDRRVLLLLGELRYDVFGADHSYGNLSSVLFPAGKQALICVLRRTKGNKNKADG